MDASWVQLRGTELACGGDGQRKRRCTDWILSFGMIDEHGC